MLLVTYFHLLSMLQSAVPKTFRFSPGPLASLERLCRGLISKRGENELIPLALPCGVVGATGILGLDGCNCTGGMGGASGGICGMGGTTGVG